MEADYDNPLDADDVRRIENTVLYNVAFFNDIKDFGWVTIPLQYQMEESIDDESPYPKFLLMEDQAQQAGVFLTMPQAISVSGYFDESINVEFEMSKGSELGWSE